VIAELDSVSHGGVARTSVPGTIAVVNKVLWRAKSQVYERLMMSGE